MPICSICSNASSAELSRQLTVWRSTATIRAGNIIPISSDTDTNAIYLHLDTNIFNLPPIEYDSIKDLHFVSHNNKRLYFSRSVPLHKMQNLYRELTMEQDPRSPHCYFSDIEKELSGRTLVDVGAAEGIIALSGIDYVEKACLFECDPGWIEALEATFEPYRDKVIITNRLVGDKDNDKMVTLSSFFSDKPDSPLFLKMDIEGMEATALRGAEALLSSERDVSFSVCTYHETDDGAEICGILDRTRCTYAHRRGFFRNRLRSVIVHGHNH